MSFTFCFANMLLKVTDFFLKYYNSEETPNVWTEVFKALHK